MEVVEIYINQPTSMQAAVFQDKKWGKPSNNKALPTKSHTDFSDPNYENITLTFRNWDQSKLNHPAPTKQAPGQPKTPPNTSKVPLWLHRAVTSMYILLALIIEFCTILCVLILVKNSEMSKELLGLKEVWNVSNTVQNCQGQQRTACNSILQNIQKAKNIIQKKIQDGNPI